MVRTGTPHDSEITGDTHFEHSCINKWTRLRDQVMGTPALYLIETTSKWVRWRLKSPASPLFTKNRYSGADQRKHQSSASLVFAWGIHRRPLNSPHKWPVTRKMLPFGDVITCWSGDLPLEILSPCAL